MTKKSITIVLLFMLSIGIVSLYSTFAYDEENATLEESTSDYNLIYALKENSNRNVSVSPHDEKYLDIELTNTYPATVKYGMYYKLVNPNTLPDNVVISLSENSTNQLEDIINPGQTKIISIKIKNSSEYSIDLIVGALIGFENGKTEELIKNGEILIK